MNATATTRWSAVTALARAFRQAEIDTPSLDARVLVCHALGLESHDLFSAPDHRLTDEECAAVHAVMERRLRREPVARIVGARWFRGRRFVINASTLDPRPESETLVDLALTFALTERKKGRLRLLDAGTGTGCLLLSLLAELPEASGVGIDVSEPALRVAATNASRLGVGPERVTFRKASIADALPETFNIIVANPPYIPSGSIDTLAPEVSRYDPRGALDGGPDGLDCYRQWLPPLWAALAKPLALLVFEVGEGQAQAVAALVRRIAGDERSAITIHRDLGGIERCVAVHTRALHSC